MLLLSLVLPRQAAQAVTDEEVERAIGQLKSFLYERQDQELGGWFGEYHRKGEQSEGPKSAKTKNLGGPSAIAALALIMSGDSPQKPALAKALKYIRSIEFTGTYAMSLRIHVWSYLNKSWLDMLEADAQALMQGAHADRSTFDYLFYEPSSRIDHSTTQYGILAMWQAAQRGARLPSKFWQNAEQHFYKAQFKGDDRIDGSWGYTMAENTSRATMTCAGLTVLYVVQQELYRDRDTPNPQLQEAIDRGMAWMNRHYSPNHGAHGGNGYYFYGVERVGLASGIKFFRNNRGDHDWFKEIADRIVNATGRQGANGSVVNSSFYLMFLSRGRVPVWITKLQIDPEPAAEGDTKAAQPRKVNWNNRPNDLYFLTKHLSDVREQELNWQTIPIDIDPVHWINAPMAYVASDEDIQWTDRQKAHLKKFIDLGGTILFNPDKGSPALKKSVERLAQELFPQYKMQNLPPDHPLYQGLYTVRSFRFRGVNNGARDLILLSDADIGKLFQQDTQYDRNDVWKLAVNLFALASDRGVLTNRLVSVMDADAGGGETFTIARASYDGNWNPEPGAWWPIAARLSARGNPVTIENPEVKLEELSTTDAKLVHLAGIEPITLTDAQKQAIQQYVAAGGTILVETIGGRGTFGIEIDRQLRELFGAPSVPLQTTDPIITGQGLAGGVDSSKVGYRRHALLNSVVRDTPRLAAFRVNDRPAIFISHEDLSLGSLRARQYGIIGYQPESARNLMGNILGWARNQAMASRS